MPLQFDCPACGQRTQAPEELIGKKARCPLCDQVIVVPQASEVPAQTELAEPEAPPEPAGRDLDTDERRRPCPICGELIHADAVRCRYCGESFVSGIRTGRRGGHSGAATASLVLGCVGLVGWCLPCLGLPINLVGLILGATAPKTAINHSQARTGLILCIIGLALSVLNALVGAMMQLRRF